MQLDFKNPDYIPIFAKRAERLNRIRANPDLLPKLKLHYKNNIAQFISDWGCTIDPRNPERQLPTLIPFILFEKQVEWVNWIIDNWKNQRPGITEKSRDMGMSWLSIGLACSLCLLYDGISIGFGSRKEEYVDKIGVPKSLLEKARLFMATLPPEFRGGWERNKHAPHMSMIFPESRGLITGECGDGIGRGDRQSIYFVDESAFLERPQLTEASLSMTTNCRQDISSANGLANPFAEKRFSGKIAVFTYRWQDDPRKDLEWYEKKKLELDPVTVASEIDINYSASVEGVVIPSEWVQSAIDAHIKLDIMPTGIHQISLDCADEGVDMNATCGRHGILIEHINEWSGKGSDIYDTVLKTFQICDDYNYRTVIYDADGLGASVRGDGRIINEHRIGNNKINVLPFRGSSEVLMPDQKVPFTERLNKDYFVNRKAQAWWELRVRFKNTHRAVNEGMTYDKDELISISSGLPNFNKLISELSQPTYSQNGAGKILIDKKPNGVKSPNMADAVMINFATKAAKNVTFSMADILYLESMTA